MRTTRTRRPTALAVAGLLALGGCGGGDPAEPQTRTAANGHEIAQADVEFAQEMLRHHAEALAVVDLTLGKELDPRLQQLVEDLRAGHTAEVETLTTWLTDWGEDVPETVRDHAHAHDGGEDHEELEAATGARFEELWVPLMAQRLEECADLAEAHEGHFAPAEDLAAAVAEDHAADLDALAALG